MKPIRREALRDLLGLVRILYRDIPSEELRCAGRSLYQAFSLADSKPGSVGHRAAKLHVEQAIEMLQRVEAGRPYVRAGVKALRRG